MTTLGDLTEQFWFRSQHPMTQAILGAAAEAVLNKVPTFKNRIKIPLKK
jgi:hypothetical protein